MTRKTLITETLTLSGAMLLTTLLLWLSLYVEGPVMLVPAAVAWVVFLLTFAKRMRTPKLVAEYGLVTGLLAAQVSLLIAIIVVVVPGLAAPLASLV